MSDAVHGSQKNHRTLLVMLGTLALVIISATILHRLAVRGVIDLPALLGTSNRGTLVSPPCLGGDGGASRTGRSTGLHCPATHVVFAGSH